MPNPYGRLGAKMQEPKKDSLRRQIEDLKHALYVAQSRREQAERRLKEMMDIANAPDGRPDPGSRIYRKDYFHVIDRALEAAEEEGGGIFSHKLWAKVSEATKR